MPKKRIKKTPRVKIRPKRKPPRPIRRPKPVKKVSVQKKITPKKIISFKPARKIREPISLSAEKDYLPLPAGYPPTLSLLRRMEEEFEGSLRRPRVSVVVVNHDGVDFLWHCLFALKTQTYLPYEIILVDNASQDTSVSFVKANYPQVKVMECQENFGFAMGSNLGAKYATGDLVALLNNDAVVTP